jgi:Tol biopolymer transport system component
MRRRSFRWIGVAVLLTAPVALGVGWFYRRARPQPVSGKYRPPVQTVTPEAAWQYGPPETRMIPFRVVFTSNVAGSFDLYVWEDGRVRPLLVHPSDDLYPTVSPDGRWLVFQRQVGRQGDIYRMDLVRGTVEALVETPADEQNPAWFPDSRRVVFDRDDGLGRQLFVVDVETRRVERLTEGTVSRNVLPAVAPDGTRVALTSSAWVGWSIALLDLRTRDLRVLVPGGSCRPDWSPDGRYLVITTQKFDGKGDIARLDVATGQVENLTPGRPDTYDYDPRWSPDGRWVVFQTTTDKERGNWQVWVLEVATGRTFRLVDSPGQDLYPNWWPPRADRP